MPEEKNECRTGMPCGLPKSGNACMNRTTACSEMRLESR